VGDAQALATELVRVLSDGALRQRLVAAARRTAEGLTVERAGDAMIHVYQEVVAERGGVGAPA
jgi:glycosyltransferase involved in cell wall biosynthesis